MWRQHTQDDDGWWGPETSSSPRAARTGFSTIEKPGSSAPVGPLNNPVRRNFVAQHSTSSESPTMLEVLETRAGALEQSFSLSSVVEEEDTGNKINMNLPSSNGGREEEACSSLETADTPTSGMLDVKRVSSPPELQQSDLESECSDVDLDSDWIGSERYDSDASVEDLETRKQNKWLRPFFDKLNDVAIDQTAEQECQWLCPACKGSGVGETDWYKGLQPLITHAKHHRKRRVRLHREFATVLEEDLERRRIGTGPFRETKFGKWKGLIKDDEVTNPLIVWPPMVIIQNTRLELDELDKWIGMGNKELLEMFKDYNPMKARHAYGPQGHRGLSLVIFPNSPTGYMNAKCLVRHFKHTRRGREHWDCPGRLMFQPGGDRILYGYMATAEDMNIFNRHCSRKMQLKWDMKRYQDAVIQPLSQMHKNKKQINGLKAKLQEQKEHNKLLEKVISLFTRKLKLKEEEIFVIRERAKKQHEENIKEMDELEQTYQQRMLQIEGRSVEREQLVEEQQQGK